MTVETMFARLGPGSRLGWLLLLAAGWEFSDHSAPAPMLAHHGQHAVLMVREVR